MAISKVGLICVWLAIEQCESVEAGGKVIEVICLTITDADLRELGA